MLVDLALLFPKIRHKYSLTLKKNILGLLAKMTHDFQDLTWKINCTYSDGKGQNIFKITISDINPPYLQGYVTFRLEDGCVINCRYKALQHSYGENIIDTLLDIIILEKRLHRMPHFNSGTSISNLGKRFPDIL